MVYTVSEASQKLGIPGSTIRFYDKHGLLPFVERSQGGMRMFTETDIERLQDILMLKDAGFTIKEIAQFVRLEDEGNSSLLPRLKMLEHRCSDVEAEINRLQDTLKTLKQKCCYYEAALENQPEQNASLDEIP